MKSDYLKKRKPVDRKLAVAVCVSFFAWSVCVAGIVPEIQKGGFVQQAAWWGSLYPRTSLKNAMRLVEISYIGEQGRKEGTLGSELWLDLGRILDEDISVKAEWKCLDLFR